MKEHGIIMQGHSVASILDGLKTQTRRAIKPQPNGKNLPIEIRRWDESTWRAWCTTDDGCCHIGWCANRWKSPYGVPGDRLWVREAFSIDGDEAVFYKATDHESCGPWKPSIFMPRWVSRILLEITDVRVERVQDISADDCRAEGITVPPLSYIDTHTIHAFMRLWDSINGKPRKDGTDISWGANPWVWVVSFRRISS